jgi:TetR/AcrR family transcriptional regulator, cholesterol catabolism regulator
MKQKEIQILTGARVLYSKYGIKNITMDDVAQHLCISKKTLYVFVKDKANLVEKVMMMEAEKNVATFQGLLQKETNAIDEMLKIATFINNFFKNFDPSKEYDLRKYYPELHTKIRETRRKNLNNASKNNITKGQHQGYYRNDIDKDLIARLHVLRAENIIDNDLFSKEEITSRKICIELFKYHIRGIANQKGIEYLETRLMNI